MRIGIIGAGNVATVLGRLFLQKNHQVVQLMSRSAENGLALASELGCAYNGIGEKPDSSVDIFVFAVSDSALMEPWIKMDFGNKLLLHTAGAVSKDVLKIASAHYGVLYPLQTLRKEMKKIPAIPCLIDGSNHDVTSFINDFALSISPIVSVTSDEQRLRLHASAVIVSNFTNHLYSLAESFCDSESLDFHLLLPLIIETAERLAYISPSLVQTGPAVRKDIQTLDKHLKLLNDHPRLRAIYLKLTESIMNP
jgi:predicted short-subunit dehydrogenase-like oxidoreductase (DUF2520 family)